MRDVVAVIPAGGVGARLGGRTPKQFLKIGRHTILGTTVRHFLRHPRVLAVVVAVPAMHVARAQRLLGPRVTVVAGGPTRQESVRLALEASPLAADLVVVHDAVRPFITRALIDDVLAAAAINGAAVAALPIAETVKRVRDARVEATVERTGLWAVQTPQAFRADLLREAHDKARREGVAVTDDAMLVERLDQSVRVVPGLVDNVKITTADDLRRARAGRR